MSGASILIDASGLTGPLAGLDRAVGVFDRADLRDGVGALLESSTRRRISEEKAGPDGEAWAAWSPAYAKTREAQHSLLVGEGDLLDSIAFRTGANEIAVGSGLVQAAALHFGGEEIDRPELPARPYLGLSEGDELAIGKLIEGAFGRALQ